jgi:uncharacterized protein YidB (DUF937 family)
MQMPSGALKGLLTVLAVAGYQNRDKIAEILQGLAEKRQPATETAGTSGSSSTKSPATSGAIDDILSKLRTGGLGSVLRSGSIGSILNGGLGDLVDHLRQAGQQKKADSWVNPGDNEPIDDNELAAALGPDVIKDIASKTGLSEEEVIKRLSKNIPDAIDTMTPGGKFPPAEV